MFGYLLARFSICVLMFVVGLPAAPDTSMSVRAYGRQTT